MQRSALFSQLSESLAALDTDARRAVLTLLSPHAPSDRIAKAEAFALQRGIPPKKLQALAAIRMNSAPKDRL